MFKNFFFEKRVLVTGHTGFKGAWLCQWLLELGAHVSGISLRPEDENCLYNALGLNEQLQYDYFHDISQVNELEKYINKIEPEIIFHLAAQPIVQRSYIEPYRTYETNVLGTLNILEILRKIEFPTTCIMITTDKCYLNKETIFAYNEESALGGHDPYSSSKAMMEILISSYRKSYFSHNSLIKLGSARAGNVIGAGDWSEFRIVPDIMRSLLNKSVVNIRNKHATRPWQHVLEPLSGYLWLAVCLNNPAYVEKYFSKYEPTFNFGPLIDSNKTVLELVKMFQELIPELSWSLTENPEQNHEAGKLNLTIDKAYHILDWMPVWNFNTTVTKTVSLYTNTNKDGVVKQINEYHSDAINKNIKWALI